MDEGTLIMSGFESSHIIKSIDIVTSKESCEIEIVNDYKSINVSEKVLRIIFSYLEYVNKNVWKKY